MIDPALNDAVTAVRAFNRFHTRFAGVLEPHYMGSELTLVEARLFYEILAREAPLASALQDALGLDAGYASRLLRRFEGKGWIERGRGTDARQRPIFPTDTGRAMFAALDERTRAEVERQLAPLGTEGRATLVSALDTARALLGDANARDWSIRTFRPGDMGAIAGRQSALYAEHHGWGRPMEVLQGEVTTSFLRDFKPGREQCWVAERSGRMLGSIFCCDSGDNAAQLRLLYVEPDARGLGIGAALVRTCTDFAREAGYAKIWLWTHSVLLSARRIYAATGFAIVSVDMHDAFGEPEQGETWEMALGELALKR
ncbi:helix-turn-helix domain-containing GNAT family N-acetyltransferase [Sphingomonas sp. LaA6.9]|uniref:bifunctional helix-turn-helix transcriptional regulator/GNAT family N-acetyltransferase n=1 Tax=Sphingomonas sp. LaA6.9 TaxID=2919914 RepID=UPI001F4F8D31|nr:helix-turn-helix domain-containing GNAT family N-acetyltransferase [Sphingomonas sp. LaA6.9]MCJ8157211.1 helix-turn-helix domain-containing GNAT family N-acetyltransferase [Sphingomonas sp. LaA6.9]